MPHKIWHLRIMCGETIPQKFCFEIEIRNIFVQFTAPYALLLELSTKFHIIQRRPLQRPSIDSSTYFAALAEVAHELRLAVLVQVEAGARPRGLGGWRPGSRCG